MTDLPPPSPDRTVPVYAAGPGTPDTALEILAWAGWSRYEDQRGDVTYRSADGQVSAEFGPETARYRQHPRTGLWQVTYTGPDPYRPDAWTAAFGDQVPAEAIAAFLQALIDSDGLDPDR